MGETYVLVQWPESQMLMEEPYYKNYSYLANTDEMIEDFGFAAYFVEENFYNKFKYKQDGKR